MAAQREWFDDGLLQGPRRHARGDRKEITRAYRKLAKQYHPDANPGSEERFKEISPPTTSSATPTSARSTTKSAASVRRGNLGASAVRRRRQRAASTSDVETSRDIFGGIFGRDGRGASRGTPGVGPQRGDDSRRSCTCPSRGRRGLVTTVNVSTRRALLDLRRLGLPPGHDAGGLPALRRHRRPQRQPGNVLPLHAVPGVRRPGTKIVDPCPTCFGTGLEQRANDR